MKFEKPPAGNGARGWIRNIPESARLRFHFRPRNQGKDAPKAAHTDAPCKYRQQLPSAGISSEVFLPTRPWHHQQNETQKNCQPEQNVDQVLYYPMGGEKCENKQHGDAVPEKSRDVFLCSPQINIKKSR